MLYASPRPSRQWSDRRILALIALGTLIVSLIWRLPEEAAYIGARVGELLFALTLALAMTYVLRPLVRFLLRWTGDTPRGRSTATLGAFLIVGIATYVVFKLGFGPVQRDVRELIEGFWPDTPAQRAAMITKWRASIDTSLEPYRFILPARIFDDPNYFPEQISSLLKRFGPWLSHQSAHLGFIVELLLVPVLAFYFLADGPAIRREARLLAPKAWRPRMASMASHFDHVLDGYVIGQAWMCIIAWVLVTFMLLILNVPYAFTLGLVAGLTRAIPIVGPILGGIPLLLVCQFYTGNTQTTLLLLSGFTLMHFLESKVLLPKIVGHHVDLHPVSVILSLLIGMEFFGFIGVFLAVPIAAVLKIVLAEYHDAQEQKAAKDGQPLAVLRSNGENGNGSGVRSVVVDETPLQ